MVNMVDMENVKGRLMPLSYLKEGEVGFIHSIRGGLSVRNRMFEMGLVTGEKIRVCRNLNRGPMMIEVKGTQIGIGRRITRKVLVVLNR